MKEAEEILYWLDDDMPVDITAGQIRKMVKEAEEIAYVKGYEQAAKEDGMWPRVVYHYTG